MKKSTITTTLFVPGVLIVLGLLTLACDTTTTGPQPDPRAEKFLTRFVEKHPLILGPGDAWIEVGTENRGFIFREDSSFDYIQKNTDSSWSVTFNGKWSVNGVVMGPTYSFRIGADGILRLESGTGVAETIILAKVSGIHINP